MNTLCSKTLPGAEFLYYRRVMTNLDTKSTKNEKKRNHVSGADEITNIVSHLNGVPVKWWKSTTRTTLSNWRSWRILINII